MNKLAIATAGLSMVFTMQVLAQEPKRSEDSDRKAETLTAEQAAQVKEILSKYDATALTAEKAKAIHEDFRKAGLRGGPAMNDTIKSAGFDPDKLRDLAPRPGDQKDNEPAVKEEKPAGGKPEASVSRPLSGFVLKSSEVADDGQLPKEFTGFGDSATLPLEWSGAPDKTKSYALIMHHITPDAKTKWYWILYNIPADTKKLPKNVKGVGTLGNNSVNGKTEYAPPHSKGTGAKTYILTLYALSAPVTVKVAPEQVNREVLLTAMSDLILASAELKVIYSRPEENKE